VSQTQAPQILVEGVSDEQGAVRQQPQHSRLGVSQRELREPERLLRNSMDIVPNPCDGPRRTHQLVQQHLSPITFAVQSMRVIRARTEDDILGIHVGSTQK